MFKLLSAIAGAFTVAAAAPAGVTTAYDITMKTIDGKPMPFSAYRGKVLLVVNTASFCGFTPQYEALQKVQKTFTPKGFSVIGVPSGDFLGQEYKSNSEIKQFCESKFGINFPMTEKSKVTGRDAAPFFAWAGASLGAPKWNFHKYLVGRDGRLIAGFPSTVKPDAPEVTLAIEKALAARA
ncbi:MAG: redoxin domain-containing protein [Sphingomonadaceae bacterium]|nr:redoxin domain-containing protein [Sphingomonadaceae bacterium]